MNKNIFLLLLNCSLILVNWNLQGQTSYDNIKNKPITTLYSDCYSINIHKKLDSYSLKGPVEKMETRFVESLHGKNRYWSEEFNFSKNGDLIFYLLGDSLGLKNNLNFSIQYEYNDEKRLISCSEKSINGDIVTLYKSNYNLEGHQISTEKEIYNPKSNDGYDRTKNIIAIVKSPNSMNYISREFGTTDSLKVYFNSKGQVSNEIGYYQEYNMSYRYTYDAQGNINTLQHYRRDKPQRIDSPGDDTTIDITHISGDDSGQDLLFPFRNCSGRYLKYDSLNNLIYSAETKSGDDSRGRYSFAYNENYFEYKYNKNYHMSICKIPKSKISKPIIYKFKYKYDEFGNWIVKKEWLVRKNWFKRNLLVKSVFRTITYFE